MSAHASPPSKGGVSSASSVTSFRAVIDSRKAEGRKLTLDDAIAIIVPVCADLKQRSDRGEKHYVHPSAITTGPDGLMRLNPQLATAPKDPRDRATLSPEMLRATGPGGPRAWVFAVGAMLYEAVTGTAVGPGMRRPRDVDPSLPEALEHLLAKALVADPSHRPDDLGALASAMHHLAPMKSIVPPDADESKLDHDGDFEVDINLSIMPPERPTGQPAPVSIPKPQVVLQNVPVAAPARAAAPMIKDPTRELANLKARLESDPRPRYVVAKDRMDHGPFSAVELLQQIASHKFVGKDGLRDELSGVDKTIDEWEEFAPFAQHARIHRDIAHEKKEVAKVEQAEKRSGAAKFIGGIVIAVALVSVGAFFIIKQVGSRKDGGELSDDPSAVDLSNGGALKGTKKPGQAGGRPGGGPGNGGGFVGGMSYEQALNSNNNEITIGAKAGPDLTDAQLGAPLRSASFISGCGAPDSMHAQVKVAIKNGRAIGVTVTTLPPDQGVAACIDRHVRGLGWPANPKMDTTTTNY